MAFLHHFTSREINRKYYHQFVDECQIDDALLQRLQLEQELPGHDGCVNCLDWNSSGSLLASGSDDTNVIIWNPFTYKKCNIINTGHQGNIFSVKFLPQTFDRYVASGAADQQIFIHDVTYNEKLFCFTCTGRVKRLVVSPDAPQSLWSASEDGMIREFDRREPTTACCKVLIDLTSACGEGAECKCLAINPTYSHILAVGANDPYVRLYDRRMMRQVPFRTTNGQKRKDNMHFMQEGCASYFIPGHLHQKVKEYRRRFRYLCATYLTFNSVGNELLVNVGGEQLYLYNMNEKMQSLYQASQIDHTKKSMNGLNGHAGPSSSVPSIHLPTMTEIKESLENCDLPSLAPEVEKLKELANREFCKEKYLNAIIKYNEAILKAPKAAVLHGNRAAAYIKRKWDGDAYAALRDCHTALSLNPNYAKVSFRVIKCLYELRWLNEAKHSLLSFKTKYPEYAQNQAYCDLEKEINKAIKTSNKSSQEDEGAVHENEMSLQNNAFDYSKRYCGHCNTTTDIKEANFFGNNGRYIIAGSDDGSFFVWERKTTNLVRVMHADDSIVNCLQPHPSVCMLATSGIDHVVRLWSPSCSEENDRIVQERESAAAANQQRMNTDPFESMMLSMGMRAAAELDRGEGDVIPCRPS